MIQIISRLIQAEHEDLAEEVYSVSYPGNRGFEEMIDFFGKANSKEIALMEKIVNAEDWNAFKALINKVLKINLK